MPAVYGEQPVNLLLVDDEPRNLEVLESVLQAPHLNLVRAGTADQALRELITGDFAALVLDIRMPGMSGIELAAIVKQRQRTRDIPIIFLTAHYQDDKDVLNGYGTGAVDYLTKPINPEILKSKIGIFVDLFQKSRALRASNEALEKEVAQRERAEEALRRINTDLEERVRQRTVDLTRLNEELATARDRAVAASRAKDEFLARLSHELRTPLNPVLLLASDAAVKSELPADVRADFQVIAAHVALEARLIDDLLDLTRITQGKLALELRPFDFNALLRETAAMLQQEVLEKQIRLTLDLPAKAPTVVGDDVRLKQIFWNILKNAVKFTGVAGGVTVESRLDAGTGTFSVRITDTGIGMTAEEIGRAFDAFSQGDHVQEEGPHKFGGLGLGLAISRMLVELHGGSIEAQSPGRGQGTTFVIRLPLAQSATLPPFVPAAAPAAEGGGGRRILLVEDHAPTRTSLTQLLQRRKYEVRAAGTLAEAREWAGREAFDLLISDVGLPDGSGYELMEEMRVRPNLVGIALTGYGTQEDVDRSLASGFSAHLTKPVSVQALDQVLREHVSRLAPAP